MSEKRKLAFSKMNYFIMIGGVLVILLGLFIMNLDKETYGLGFMGITLGPIVVMLGFLTQFVAILYKSKNNTTDELD